MGGLGAASLATLLYGMLVEAERLTLERPLLRLPRWPAELAGFRIGLIADCHLRDRYTVRLARRAVDAILAARWPHHFLGIDLQGRTCVVATRGNPNCHVILRGGYSGPNYDPVSVINTEEAMRRESLDPRIMIDCSHANSGKKPHLQAHVLRDVVQQKIEGNTSIIGFMLESNLKEGNQKLTSRPENLEYGLSITDPCISWETTERLLRETHDKLAACGGCATRHRS